jgi:hypothetical protein
MNESLKMAIDLLNGVGFEVRSIRLEDHELHVTMRVEDEFKYADAIRIRALLSTSCKTPSNPSCNASQEQQQSV